MDIILDKKNPTEALIKITLKETDYQPKVQEKLKEYSKKASIKGFRPGKVPPALIKKMYGKSILVDEINHLLSHSITDYIKDNNLKILGEPLPETKGSQEIDWENQKDYEFTYNIGLVDEFQYEISDKIEANKYDIELDDAYLNETIENLQKQFGKEEEAEVSEENDQLYGVLKQEESGFEKEILFTVNEIDSAERENFIGKSKEDEIKLNLRKCFNDDEKVEAFLDQPKEEVQNLDGDFTFTIQKITRNVPAEIDQEFFDKVFGKDVVSNEEEFRQKVHDTIKENYNREAENYLNHEIKEKLIEATEIKTPDDFLKRWLLVTNEGKVTQQDVDKEYDLYLKELKWNLIQNKIMEDNDLKVEHEEVVESSKDLLRKQFMAYGAGAQIEEILDKYSDEYLKGDKGENYMRIMNQVKNEKILTWIKNNISIKDQAISLDEFKKVASN